MHPCVATPTADFTLQGARYVMSGEKGAWPAEVKKLVLGQGVTFRPRRVSVLIHGSSRRGGEVFIFRPPSGVRLRSGP